MESGNTNLEDQRCFDEVYAEYVIGAIDTRQAAMLLNISREYFRQLVYKCNRNSRIIDEYLSNKYERYLCDY